ncbi:coiled-coil domain-containing protein 55-domain containing protein [Elsinoe ampelina]|uniref:Coiled-coil domain-containing protein 55-domain containing protein n=1 Tax=Elsinoe ampelina TaxID=302913 RepID=A0A6A6FZS6_9PEZI|nr:coiled-coil domain-containing protein 55-domain containing protein [Elsinoe ampelina]
MNISFGLNVKPNSSGPLPPSKAPKPTIFDSDSESDTPAPSAPPSRTKPSRKPPTQPPSLSSRPRPRSPTAYTDLSSTRETTRLAEEATTLDPNIYDYDTFHASKSAVEAHLASEKKRDAQERKPKYITNLLSAAAQRKQDQALAKEKALQREREAEGDAFKDTETFVTDAYKKQREENARVEEEEKRKREEEERRRGKGSGLGAFYKGVLGEQERIFEEKREAAERALREGVTASDPAATTGKDTSDLEAARLRGVNVLVNEDGEVADKRQLLSAGLNVGKSGAGGGGGGAEHLRSDTGQKHRENAFRPAAGRGGDRGAQRERQTRLMEEQLEASAKRKKEEEELEREELERKAKSRKTEGEVLGAKERYLARKREREEAAKKGG